MTRPIALLVTALALAACGQPGARQTTVPQRPTNAAPATQTTASDQECFVAAAEAFEALTEAARSAAPLERSQRSAAAHRQALACEPSLDAQQSSTLDNIVGRIGMAEMTDDRTTLALSAVEAYRLFVSAQRRTPAGIPLEVSLLDYAGFRYQAGAESTPPLWANMRQALGIADQQWGAVSARVSDSHLKSAFNADLVEMHASLDASDQMRAQRAVARELNHVDLLESYFSRPARG